MNRTITIQDVIDSYEKYRCVLKAMPSQVRDLKSLDPGSKYDTAYVPLKFRHVNGKLLPVEITLSEIIAGSSAKPPHGFDPEESKASQSFPKSMSLAFMNLTKEDIACGDYVPKKKKTEEAQEAENKRVEENIERYHQTLPKFLRVLDIIDESYKTVCAQLMADYKSLSFRLNKEKKGKPDGMTINSIKQVSRSDETGEEIMLDSPIFRLKIPICRQDGRLGIWSNYYKKFIPTVFDVRKMTKKNNYARVPATIKEGGKRVPLDIFNANQFITARSLLGGCIRFDCIISSKFGLSLSNSFKELYVYQHKSKAQEPIITSDIVQRMRGADSEEEDSDSDDGLDGEGDEGDEGDEGEGEDDENAPHDSDAE